MDSTRTRRIARLAAARSRELDVARGELARARRATGEAEAIEAAASRAWRQRAEALASTSFTSIDDLMISRAHLEGLRLRETTAAAALASAREAENTRREACIRAEREVRKVEIWREKIEEAERAITVRRERVTADEIAARTFAKGES
jgi:flagellar biosynthesis chaperone FliJ